MKIDYTIVNIINKQIESYGNRIRRVQVDVSESDKRNVKIIGDVLYVKALESEYEIARIAAEQINKDFREEDILGPNKEIEAARRRHEAIEYFEASPEEGKKRWERQRRIKQYKRKRENDKVKKAARRERRETNREKIKNAIKGFTGLAVLAPGIILGTIAASKSIQAGALDNTDNSNTIVENDKGNYEYNNQLRDKIDDVIKSEISKATGSEKKDISFESEWIDSKTKKTVLNVGDEEYKYIQELGGISTGNLRSKGIINLISAANEAKTTDELISALNEANKFSKEKDLKVEGKKIVEVDSKEDDFER